MAKAEQVMDSMDDCHVYQTDRCKLIVKESARDEFDFHLVIGTQGHGVSINDTAAMIWEHCEQPIRVSDLIQQLQIRYPDVPDLDADIRTVLLRLCDLRALEFSKGRVELLSRRDVALRLDRQAAYFSVLAHEKSIHLYYRGIGSSNGQFYANTLHTTSKNGVSFRKPEMVLDDTHAAHNFFAFVDPNFGFRGIGGQYATTGKPHSDGVYSFESQDGSTWTNEARVISPSHPGFIDATKIWGKESDIDGHLCAYYDDAIDEYVIFMRANPRQESRHIQYATGKKFGAFGPLRLLDVEDFDIERGDNLYSPCFFKVDDLDLKTRSNSSAREVKH